MISNKLDNLKVKIVFEGNEKNHASKNLMLGAIGIVFGDIGTSPLYALKECFDATHGIAILPETILGTLSLIFWSILIVVSIKYLTFIMKASNQGEGGILALMALALRATQLGTPKRSFLLFMGIWGACMFYGDAIITPSISVLSAIEGLHIVSPKLSSFVLPLTILVLLTLFLFQKKGTSSVGKFFGPTMICWFVTIGAIGLYHLCLNPLMLKAINPSYAFSFLVYHHKQSFTVLGSVFLVLTGAEALYADMGHFGSGPIRSSWFKLIMPCLLLNYFGQGSLLLENPANISNPFFLMVPTYLTLPLLLIATSATIIASQAVITGTYSLTHQAMLMGIIPKMRTIHTSDDKIGQIYIPFVNWTLCTTVILTVLIFKNSDSLAAAYGIAVSTTMLITTIFTTIVMLNIWKWNSFITGFITSLFLALDCVFLAANFSKIKEGGWLPLILGAFCFILITTWYKGKKILRQKGLEDGISLDSFVRQLTSYPPTRVEGTAVFLTAHLNYVPETLIYNLRHNKVLHERVVFLKIMFSDVPYLDDNQKIVLKNIDDTLYLVKASFGFKETANIQKIFSLIKQYYELDFVVAKSSFFVSKDTIIASGNSQMSHWRQRLFSWLYRNSNTSTDFFQIPSSRVIEMGAVIEI